MLMRSPARWTRPTRRAPPGFITPAQPVLALKPPVGPGWLFAVKHDGFRIVARKEGDGVHLWSRNRRDCSVEFSGITAALRTWKVKSFVLDSEACACDEKGLRLTLPVSPSASQTKGQRGFHTWPGASSWHASEASWSR